MNAFRFNDAVRFKLATQQEDMGAKIQVFIGVFLGVLLRWIYSIAVEVIKNEAPLVLWIIDSNSDSPCGGFGCDLLRIFRLLAESKGPTCQYAVLECHGLWHHDGCHNEFMATIDLLRS